MASQDTLALFDCLAARPAGAAAAGLGLRNGHVVLGFDDSSAASTDFFGVLPSSYTGGGLRVVLSWAAESAGAGDVRWAISYERHAAAGLGSEAVDLDTDAFSTAVEAVAAAPASSGKLAVTEIALAAAAAGDPQPGESFRLRITRMAGDPVDSMSGAAQLLHLLIKED